MPNSIGLYKRIFLHVIAARIIVPWSIISAICSVEEAILNTWTHPTFYPTYFVKTHLLEATLYGKPAPKGYRTVTNSNILYVISKADDRWNADMRLSLLNVILV